MRSDFTFLYDNTEIFDAELSSGEKVRVCIEIVDKLCMLEILMDMNEEELKYPLVVAQLEKNPNLLENSILNYVISLKDEISNTFIPVGLAIVSKDRHLKNSFHINELSIDESYQSLGLGSLLLKKIEEDAFISDISAITLQCYENEFDPNDNYPARLNFYKLNGFEEIYGKVRNLMYFMLKPIEEKDWIS